MSFICLFQRPSGKHLKGTILHLMIISKPAAYRHQSMSSNTVSVIKLIVAIACFWAQGHRS